jgi:hypothetical protein
MKKNITAGVLVAGLIVAGGAGYYLGNGNAKINNQMEPQTVRMSQATPLMNTSNVQGLQPLVQKQDQTQNSNSNPNTNQNGTFEEMLPFMKKMHPNLSDDQLKDLYDQMMGPSGACSNMMGNFNGNTQ